MKFINIPGPFTNTFKYNRWNLFKVNLVVKAIENILCKCGGDKISLLLLLTTIFLNHTLYYATWRNMSMFGMSNTLHLRLRWAWSEPICLRLQLQLNSLTSQFKGFVLALKVTSPFIQLSEILISTWKCSQFENNQLQTSQLEPKPQEVHLITDFIADTQPAGECIQTHSKH